MGPISNGGTGGMGYRGMGHMGNRGTGGMGYKGYGPHQQWVTWAMGNGVQGYGQWGPWAICTQNVKKMSSCQKECQVVTKKLNCQKDDVTNDGH